MSTTQAIARTCTRAFATLAISGSMIGSVVAATAPTDSSEPFESLPR